MAEYIHVYRFTEILMKPKNANCGFKKTAGEKKLNCSKDADLVSSFLDVCVMFFHVVY